MYTELRRIYSERLYVNYYNISKRYWWSYVNPERAALLKLYYYNDVNIVRSFDEGGRNVRNRYVPTEVIWRCDLWRRRVDANSANDEIIRRDEIDRWLFPGEVGIRDKGRGEIKTRNESEFAVTREARGRGGKRAEVNASSHSDVCVRVTAKPPGLRRRRVQGWQ
jgi:hypothetical protein